MKSERRKKKRKEKSKKEERHWKGQTRICIAQNCFTSRACVNFVARVISLSLSLCLSRAHSQYSIIQLLFSSSGKPISQVRRRRLGTYLTRRRQSLPTIRRSVTSSPPKTACCFPEFPFPCLLLSFFLFSFLHYSRILLLFRH